MPASHRTVFWNLNRCPILPSLIPLEIRLMLKSVANSKLFFVALGMTVALVGARVSADPSEKADSVERSAERIADALEKLQRDGLDIKVGQKWGSDEFKVKVVK
jgi:hypothetical protein